MLEGKIGEKNGEGEESKFITHVRNYKTIFKKWRGKDLKLEYSAGDHTSFYISDVILIRPHKQEAMVNYRHMYFGS